MIGASARRSVTASSRPSSDAAASRTSIAAETTSGPTPSPGRTPTLRSPAPGSGTGCRPGIDSVKRTGSSPPSTTADPSSPSSQRVVDIQGRAFAHGGDLRLPAHDPQAVALVPEVGHQAVVPLCPHEGDDHLEHLGVRRAADLGPDDHADTTQPVLSLVLDQLIVRRPSAE